MVESLAQLLAVLDGSGRVHRDLKCALPLLGACVALCLALASVGGAQQQGVKRVNDCQEVKASRD
jgi:hypothetical protein